MKIHFNDLNDLLNKAVEIKKDYDKFCNTLEEASKNIKQVKEDITTLIIIFIIGDGFL
jgi:peptidoglycan hydrolase CwlO-like protein